MEVRHNTVLLERAVEQVVQRASIPTMEAQANANALNARATALKMLAGAASVALVLVGGAYAYSLLTEPEPEPALEPAIVEAPAEPEPSGETEVAKTEDRLVPESAPIQNPEPVTSPGEPPATPPPSSIAERPITTQTPPARGPVVTDFTKFNEREVNIAGRTYVVHAGHRYDNEEDTDWQRAWCYTDVSVEGLDLDVALAVRSSSRETPTGPRATSETLAKANINREEALALIAACPWSDREFSIDEIRTSGPNPFRTANASVQTRGRDLIVRGPIEIGLHEKIERASFDTLVIESTGGVIDEAMRIGDWLRRNNKDVLVDQLCLSACSLILAGGESRTVAPSARVGVHRFSRENPLPDDGETAQVKSSQIISFLERMGVDIGLFHAMASVSSEAMRYLSRSEMLEWNLISSQAPLPLTPASPEPPAVQAQASIGLLRGFDLPGGDFQTLRDVTLSRCQRACEQNPTCRSFTYNTSVSWCFLKRTIPPRQPFADAVSGIKRQ